MPDIIRLNSKKGLVTFTEKELATYDLLKWVRTSFKGIGKRGLIQDGPFETVAAKLFVEKYPQSQIHLAEKCLLKQNGEVHVFLKISNQVSSEMYNQHSNQIVIRKQEKGKIV